MNPVTTTIAFSIVAVGISFLAGAWWGVWASHNGPQRDTTAPSAAPSAAPSITTDPISHHPLSCRCVGHR